MDRPAVKMRIIGIGVVVCLLILLGPSRLFAGTTGKIAGQVFDENATPVPGVTVVVMDQNNLGAYTDTEGRYVILNVPAGTHEVRISHIAYSTLAFKEIVVTSDQTTRLDAALGETTVEMETIEIRAERPIVDVNLTSSLSTVTRGQIESLPVQDLDDVVNLQAGVVDGHIRGGRKGEVQYQVDGVTVNNLFDNKSSLKVDRSLLQEVQVISGVFDAEYGQAMSGVVNAVLKDGTDQFEWNAEVYGGGFVFPGHNERLANDDFLPSAVQNYQLGSSGPLPLPKTVYIVSGTRHLFDDYVHGDRLYVPTDSLFTPSGNGEEVALGYKREWSGLAKITNTSLQGINLSYQAIFNQSEQRRSNFRFRFNPDGLSKQRNLSITHGLDWTHTLSPSTYYKVSFRQNYVSYKDQVYDDLFDPRYDAAGSPDGVPFFEWDAFYRGVEFTRWRQKTNTFLLAGSFNSQVNHVHLVKVGGEFHLPKVRFGNAGHLSYEYDQVEGEWILRRRIDEPPGWPGPREYDPVIGAVYVQDQIEMKDITLRAGLRLEHFDSRATIPSDLSNPANAIEGAPPSKLVSTSAKTRLAPRLGVAYPISNVAGVHFSYGHFYQFPALGEIFSNADYSKLTGFQAGQGIDPGVLGNPDIKPEKTVQYELGYKHALTEDFGLDLNLFYKDIRDLLGIEFITTYNDADYKRLTNTDFGNVIGFTFAVDHRRIGPLSASLDYTWQLAEGNASDPRETADRADAGEDARPRLIPLNWDQRHTFNMTVMLSVPSVYSVSAVMRVASGQPYTPTIEEAFGTELEANGGRKPTAMLLDFRAERTLYSAGREFALFTRVFNALDTRFFNGEVFPSTGSVDYTRFETADINRLIDPSRFYPPRRIEIGLKLGSGS